MSRPFRIGLALLTGVLLTGGLVGGIVPQASAAAVCGPAWSIVPTPNVGAGFNAITDIAVVTMSDAWAVGSYLDDAGTSHTLAEHWDGLAWTVVQTPDGASGTGTLSAVTALSSNDVWAVGSSTNGYRLSETLALHWDGVAWRVVPSPDPTVHDNLLTGISALSADDIWAVGQDSVFGAGDAETLAMHWDGTSWTQVSTIDPSLTNNYLFDVEAISGSDVWAVGSYLKDDGLIYQVLYEHWDGVTFTVVPGPNVVQESVYGIDSVSSDDVWAVGPGGYPDDPGNPFSHHWDGTGWHDISIVPVGLGPLNEVAAVFSSDVWAVGQAHDLAQPNRTLAENWDGQEWSVVGTPDVGEGDNVLASTASAPGADQVWAVGNYLDENGSSRTLAMWICPMAVRDQGFSNPRARVGQGLGMAWVIPSLDGGAHSVADATGMGLFNSGPRAPGSSFTYTFPGAGTYRASDDTTADSMTVTVPILASPHRGHPTTTFTVSWATHMAPSDYAFDIQIRRPGSGWEDWLTGQVRPSATFTPDAGTGVYGFRGRLRYLLNGKSSGYSPPVSITVR